MRAFSRRSSHLATKMTLLTSRMWEETSAKPAEGAEKSAEKTEKTNETVSKLEKELEKARAEIAELKKEILYRAADAENARRIGREDVDKAKLYGITSFGKDILEVADTLEKGVEAFNKIPEEQLASNKNLNSICVGVKLSIKVLQKNMAKHGIEKMALSKGDKFDPNQHDALARLPATDECPNDSVKEILKHGYKIKDRVLRAAQVAVASDEC